MSLLFMESFNADSLANIILGGRWDSKSDAGGFISLSTSAGPFSDGLFHYNRQNNLNNGYITKTLGTAQTTLIVGFFFKLLTQPGGTSAPAKTLIAFHDGGTEQVALTMQLNGTAFAVYQSSASSGTKLAGFSTYTAPTNSWIYVEWKVVFGTGTAGSTQLRVNGVDIIASTGSINTAPSGTAQATVMTLGEPDGQNFSFWEYEVSSLYLINAAGAQNNTFLGQKRITVFRPTATGGGGVQFTPLAGSNFSEVNANPSTGDSSYNSSSTVSNKDLFTHAAASGLINVAGVQVSAIRRIDNAGPNTDSVTMYDGTTAVDATAIATPVSYQWNCAIRETELTGGAFPLTNSDITNLQFGYKLAS